MSKRERAIFRKWDAAQAGGLISFLRIPGNDGHATLRVSVYMCSENVEVLS